MRVLLILVAMVVSTVTEAATLRCRGFAFGYAEFTCDTIAAPAAKAAPFCDVMNRQGGSFAWSRNDTDGTKNRADLINAAGKKLCGWGKR